VKVDKIDIVFENCEHIEVPYSDVHYLYIGDISQSILDNNILLKSELDLQLELRKYAKYARIILKNKPEYERIKQYNDITHIALMREDQIVECIGIDWKDGSSEYENLGQVVTVKDNEIHIRINIDEEDW
jgi:hypothetical protein